MAGIYFLLEECYRQIGDKKLPGGEYCTANSCVTVLKHTVDYWCGLRIFPITENFYLTGIE